MKVASMTSWAVVAGGFGGSDAVGQAVDRRVSVCMENGPDFDVRPLAQQIASKMFAEAGVTIDWRRGLAGCPALSVRISLSSQAPADVPPEALAYSLPYDGSHIAILYERLQRRVRPVEMSSLLAHVLVHEITHLLQGIHRHSDRGVMKAQWNGSDYQAMRFKPLSFTAEDIRLIQRGLADRAARAASPQQGANTEGATAVTK